MKIAREYATTTNIIDSHKLYEAPAPMPPAHKEGEPLWDLKHVIIREWSAYRFIILWSWQRDMITDDAGAVLFGPRGSAILPPIADPYVHGEKL